MNTSKAGFGLLAAAALIAIVAVASSLEAEALTTAADAWVASGQTILVEEQSFTIYLSSRTNEIAADYGKGSLFVKNNSCEATALARVCLDNIQYDFTAKAFKARVRGISLAPSLTITRAASKTEFAVGDAAVFTVTLKNSGGLARNVTFSDILPEEFSISEAEGIQLQADRAVWRGSLDEGESRSFTYNVKAVDQFEGALAASATYFDGLRLKTIYSSSITLKTKQAVELLTILGAKASLLGQRNNVTVNISNFLPEDAVIPALDITFDPGLKVTSRPYAVKEVGEGVYRWKGEIPRVTNRTTNTTNLSNAWINVTKSFFFEFKGTRAGSSDIRAKAEYMPRSGSQARQVPESKQSVAISAKDSIVRNSLDEATIESNQGKTIKMWLQNLNPYVGLRNVYVNISTDLLYLPDAYFAKMGDGEQKLLVEKFFYAPEAEKSKGYTITTNVSYFTEFGDNFSKTFTDTVTVQPVQEVTLTQAVSKTSVKANEEIEVSVTVKNSRPTHLKNVRVYDNVSDGFTVIGKKDAVIEVRSKESVKAYTYKLKGQHTARSAVLHVNTTMGYSDRHNSDAYLDPKDYQDGKSAAITIEPESLPLTISTTVDDTSIHVGEVFDVKYAVKNPTKDQAANNIVFRIPLLHELDLVDSKGEEITIGRLDPEETITLTNVEKRRAKLGGTAELEKPTLEYENIYGDKFTANGTATAISVKEDYARGPMVLINKTAPQSANNTDDFTVTLTIKNTGTVAAKVQVADEGKDFTLDIEPGEVRSINQTLRYATPGNVVLPKATAAYSYGGSAYKTASKAAAVQIINNPVVWLEKKAPESSTNIDAFTVLLVMGNKAEAEVTNLTVTDGERSWAIGRIGPKGSANISYETSLASTGSQGLGEARATYNYGKELYESVSNRATINIEEKKLMTVSKEISPKNATKGEKAKVTIIIKNIHTEPLDAIIADGEKSFTARLEPGREEALSYEKEAESSLKGQASATYTYNGVQHTSLSAEPEFSITEEGEAQEKEPEEERKSGLLSTIARKMIGILTWKRGG